MSWTGREGPTPGEASTPRLAVLRALKRTPGATLTQVAQDVGTSRPAAWKHLVTLEGQGLVHREYERGRRGRPRARFRLAPSARRLFPEAYVQLSLHAMGYVERTQGRDGVTRMFQDRAEELRRKHRPRLQGKPLSERVGELARIRDEEGYMACSRRTAGRAIELLEHNCPILAIAERYGEACEVERRLFASLLDANVTVRHRVVSGDPVCRFLVRPDPSGRS